MSGKVGMIGVGVMGFAMARNLRQAGFDVVGYDPAPARVSGSRESAGRVVEIAAPRRGGLPDPYPVAALRKGARRRRRRRERAWRCCAPRDSRDRVLDVAAC